LDESARRRTAGTTAAAVHANGGYNPRGHDQDSLESTLNGNGAIEELQTIFADRDYLFRHFPDATVEMIHVPVKITGDGR
jgi:hypothetical protein